LTEAYRNKLFKGGQTLFQPSPAHTQQTKNHCAKNIQPPPPRTHTTNKKH